MVDDLLNGALASPVVAPPLGSGNSPQTAYGAGPQSSTASMRSTGTGRSYASSNTAILMVWLILLALLVLSHTFTISLQE